MLFYSSSFLLHKNPHPTLGVQKWEDMSLFEFFDDVFLTVYKGFTEGLLLRLAKLPLAVSRMGAKPQSHVGGFKFKCSTWGVQPSGGTLDL